MDIGDKLLLHKVAFPSKSTEEDEFVAVTVIDKKTDVPDMWVEKRIHIGYLASGDNNTFELNWNNFPSDSMTPNWMWINQTTSQPWYDIVYVRDAILFKPVFLKRYPFVKYCRRHGNLYYGYREIGCFDCYMEKTYGVDHIQEKAMHWRGWR